MTSSPASIPFPIITLTTDFGLQDPFIGSMKGVILQIAPITQVIDISHLLNPFDIFGAAFLVSCFYSYFPEKTIHCIVVDPGVGSERRAIVALTKKYTFIAPDNGILSYIYDQNAFMKVIHLQNPHYALHTITHTFHGRDIFAPAAAWLSKGIPPEELGPSITDYCLLDLPKPKILDQGKRIYGEVIYIDIFGNLLTNIKNIVIEERLKSRDSQLIINIGGNIIDRFCHFYADLGTGERGCIIGSQGYLELFANQASLAKQLGIKKGDKVEILFD